MVDIKKLKLETKDLRVLYVEDNEALRQKATKLIKKFFNNVYVGYDGANGLEQFKEHSPHIVITDINMPNMDGIELSKQIKKIAPETKIIIMSAFDDKDYLYKAIELGVKKYLNKPVDIVEFKEVMFSVMDEFIEEKNAKMFNANLKNIFHYQSSIVVMLKDSEPVFVNQIFLDYFDVENLEEFKEKYTDLGKLFLVHKGFLYNKESHGWYEEISQNSAKLYNVKIEDKDKKLRHFALKYQEIPDKDGYGILSFDDLTELNLLQFYGDSQEDSEEQVQDSKTMFKLLDIIKRNGAKVKLHNYYKGLSITNDASLVQIKENSIVVKTNFLQQKAVQLELNTIITSDSLPHVISCDKFVKLDFSKQTVEFKEIKFVIHSAVDRKTIRLKPSEKDTISLVVNKNRFRGNSIISDISLDALNIKLDSLPPGLKVGGEVAISTVLNLNEKPLNIDVYAVVLKIIEKKSTFNVIVQYELSFEQKKLLTKYITNRQMELIREFKGKSYE